MSSPVDAFSLTRLFIAPGSIAGNTATLAQDWIGATLTYWDPTSYANLVLVGPITLQNLPVLAPSALTEGTVLLAKVAGTYVIMGNLGSVRMPGFLDPIRYRYLQGDVTLSSTTLVDAGILNFLLNTNTAYGIDGTLFYTADSSSDIKFGWTGPANMAAKWGMTGITLTTVVNGLNAAAQNAYGSGATIGYGGSGALETSQVGGWFATTDTPGLLQLQAGLNSGSTAATLAQGSWLRITELGGFGGANTFIKQYVATGSRSYDSHGNPIGSPDQDNNLYTWSLSGRNFGSEAHMWTFNAAQLRADLAGATLLSAQMYLFLVTASSIPADLSWRWSTTSAIAATFPDNGFGGGDVKNLWRANSWASFDITTQLDGVLSSNANSVLGGSYNFSDSASEFRGFGFSVATRPYLQIFYSI